jgi:acyl-coenzyme A synthetase/AMP-(fatty) acid ligase
LRFCSDSLPAFKAPKQIVVCTSLPKTERGKLDRRALLRRWSLD